MTNSEIENLVVLLEIADEENTPLTEDDIEFLTAIDENRARPMTGKQEQRFQELVDKHINGRDEDGSL
jgi:hypothetical protein